MFNVTSAEETSAVLVALMQSAQEQATHLFMARQAKTIPFELVERTFAGLTQAFVRILGISPRSLTFQDRATLDLWFG